MERERSQAANKVEALESHMKPSETLNTFHSIFTDILGLYGGCKDKV